MNDAENKLMAIGGTLLSGRTVIVSTHTHATQITPATAKRWADNGHALFRIRGESLYMASGKRWVCVDWCRFTSSD